MLNAERIILCHKCETTIAWARSWSVGLDLAPMHFTDAASALRELLSRQVSDLVVAVTSRDVELALTLVRRLKQLRPKLRVACVSKEEHESIERRCRQAGADLYVYQPDPGIAVQRLVKEVMRAHQPRARPPPQRYESEEET